MNYEGLIETRRRMANAEEKTGISESEEIIQKRKRDKLEDIKNSKLYPEEPDLFE